MIERKRKIILERNIKNDKKTRHYISYIVTAIVGIYIICNISLWVGKSLGGNYNWLFLPSKMFGMPEKISQYDKTEPLFKYNDGSGWDGQFYYYISNDLLGTKGYSNNVDSPSYRWQRIGLPLIAKIISMCLLKKQVSVLVYTMTNLLIVLLGFFCAIKYLKKINRTFTWAIPWVLSCGVMVTIRCGLPDAAADALFIMAFLFLLEHKYIWYAILMTMTCLSREGYVLIAFCIFIIFISNKFKKILFVYDGKIYFKNFFIMAMPGIFFLIWYLYVGLHFGIMPYKQASGITKIYLVGWIQNLINALSTNNYVQVVGLSFYLVVVVWSLIAAVRMGKKRCIYWGLIPYIILVSSFGDTVLCHWTGYLKGISVLYFLLPFMVLQYNDQFITIEEEKNNKLENQKINITQRVQMGLGVFLIFSILMSYVYLYNWGGDILKENYFYNPVEISDDVQTIENYDCKFEVLSYDYDKFSKMPEKFVTPYAIANIYIKNNGNQIWSNIGNSEGNGAVKISYQVFQNGKVIQEGERYNLLKSVQPGEEMEREIFISYPKEKGKYIVRISLIQEGVSWFYQQNMGYEDVEINIK